MSKLPTSHGDLWVRTFGAEPYSVVALHGFTLHGGMFGRLAAELGVGIAAPDLPGHGRTAVAPVTIATAVAAVEELLATLSRPVLLGYSQGARIALQVALNRPDLIDGLVLVSGSPGLPERARQLRQIADDALASRIEQIGIETFIDEWLANPMTSTAAVSPEERETDRALRLENTATGLAAALRGIGQAAVPDATDRVPSLRVPVGFIAGERDRRYAQLATAMAAACGTKATLIAGAGHNVVLEQPHAVADALRAMLNR